MRSQYECQLNLPNTFFLPHKRLRALRKVFTHKPIFPPSLFSFSLQWLSSSLCWASGAGTQPQHYCRAAVLIAFTWPGSASGTSSTSCCTFLSKSRLSCVSTENFTTVFICAMLLTPPFVHCLPASCWTSILAQNSTSEYLLPCLFTTSHSVSLSHMLIFTGHPLLWLPRCGELVRCKALYPEHITV